MRAVYWPKREKVTGFRMYEIRGGLVLCGQHDLLASLNDEPDLWRGVITKIDPTMDQYQREMVRRPEVRA